MVSHHAPKFGDHSHYGSGDIMFLGVEEQDSTFSHMACHALTLEISERRHRWLLACPRGTPGTGHTCLQQKLTERQQKILSEKE